MERRGVLYEVPLWKQNTVKESLIFNDHVYNETTDMCQTIDEDFSTVTKKLQEFIKYPMSASPSISTKIVT